MINQISFITEPKVGFKTMRMVMGKIFDADFHEVMVSVGFKDTPRECYTVGDMLRFREIEQYI